MKQLLKLFEDNRVVNWHEHVWLDSDGNLDKARLEEVVTMARATHTDVLVCSNPVLAFDCNPELFCHCNDTVYEAMQMYPGFIEGMCFVNPGHVEEALVEIERCVTQLGFIGVKLYNHYYISDPAVEPVIKKCRELNIPILEHACKLNFYQEYQPFASDGTHFAQVAKKFPDVTFIHAHISGGGDWQWSLKAIAPYANVFTDISGSVCDEGIVEETVRFLGADRVLYGTDMSYSACTGKMLAADIPLPDKIKILNNPFFAKYLERGCRL